MFVKRWLVAGIAVAVVGCAAPVEESTDVSAATDALTLEECDQQFNSCLAEYPFFGLFTCPAQLSQCRLTASNGLPAQVVAAIADTAACVEDGRACRRDAGVSVDSLECVRDEALCLGAIVGIEPPQVVTETAECVRATADCIQGSESASDLDACGEAFRQCSVDVLVGTLPPELQATVEDLTNCRFLRGQCADAASTPGELAQCAEDHLLCVGETLGVDFPDPPVAEALQCGEEAAACGFNATSLEELRQCRSGLRECVVSAVAEELTCEQEWTQCLATRPFGFLSCTIELADCSD